MSAYSNRWLTRALIRAAWLLACLLASPSAWAESGKVGVPLSTCIALDHGEPTRVMLDAPGRFDCRTPQARLGRGDFWVRTAALPRDAGLARTRVRFSSLWQDALMLTIRYADGDTRTWLADQHGIVHHLQMGATVEMEIPARKVRVTDLLWRIRGSANIRGAVISPRLATPEESAGANLKLLAFYTGFIGVCVALLVYNLAMWVALRHRFQLVYSAMLVSLGLNAVSGSGALAWLLPCIGNNDRSRISYLTLAVATAAGLSFMRSFFGGQVFGRRVSRLTDCWMVAMLGSAIAFIVLAPWQVRALDTLYSACIVSEVLIVGPVLVRAFRLRSAFLMLFALAWGTQSVFAGLRITTNLHVSGYSFWIDNSMLLSMLVQALMSSIAIAYRINLLSKERDAALKGEIAAQLLADTDPLTGLLNRRAFLKQAIGREGEQLLVIVDIDHFKLVNETIGHDGGDDVLRVFARTLENGLPPDALVARIGGEEFAVLCSVNDAFDPPAILERLRTARMPFDLSVTASIGTCIGPLRRETDWKALYRRADRALFDAKSAGRDQVSAGEPLALAA